MEGNDQSMVAALDSLPAVPAVNDWLCGFEIEPLPPPACALLAHSQVFLNEVPSGPFLVKLRMQLQQLGKVVLGSFGTYFALARGVTSPAAVTAERLGRVDAVRRASAGASWLRGTPALGGRETEIDGEPQRVIEVAVGTLVQHHRLADARKLFVALTPGGAPPTVDAKSLLQNYGQTRLGVAPIYKLVNLRGSNHEQEFVAEVTLGRDKDTGVGRSKRQAEKAAALKLLTRLAPSTVRESASATPSSPPCWRQFELRPCDRVWAKHVALLVGHDFADPRLLAMALTHRTFSNEHPDQYPYANDLLVALGMDAIAIAILAALLRRLPGTAVTLIANACLMQSRVASVARTTGLAQEVRLGKGGPRDDATIAQETAAACFGALYVDSGERFLERLQDTKLGRAFLNDLEGVLQVPNDEWGVAFAPKSALQELCQGIEIELEYLNPTPIRLTVGSRSKSASIRSAVFRRAVAVRFGSEEHMVTAEAANKAEAETEAARAMLRRFLAPVGPRLSAELARNEHSFARWYWRALRSAVVGAERQHCAGGTPRLRARRSLGFLGLSALADGRLQSGIGKLACAYDYFFAAGVPENELTEVSDSLTLLVLLQSHRVVVTLGSYVDDLSALMSALDLSNVEVLARDGPRFQTLALVASFLGRLGQARFTKVRVADELRAAIAAEPDFLRLDGPVPDSLVVAVEGALSDLALWLARAIDAESGLQPLRISVTNDEAECVTIRFNHPRLSILIPILASSPVDRLISAALDTTNTVDGEAAFALRLPYYQTLRGASNSLGARLALDGLCHLRSQADEPLLSLFAATFHDLKNNALAIVTASRLSAQFDSKRHQHLATAERLREGSLILLAELRQLNAPYKEPVLKPLDVRAFMRELASDWQTRLPYDVQFQSDLDASQVTVAADEVLLRLAIQNLLRNAVEAAGQPARVRLEWAPVVSEDSVQVQITNNGTPVAPDVVDAVARNALAPSTKHAGPGVGLAAVRSAVHAHGGTFSIVPTKCGTTATIKLPTLSPPGDGE
jgi:dsRNA-specific ribonuclease/signal transduction histidine kinase